jgi:hypothetical protein
VSGESTRSTTSDVAAFEHAFGDEATCNRCRERIREYRVLAVFLHDTVAVRAYCAACYEAALEGEYHARGDGVILDYAAFVERFGNAGPPPPPCTPVDRALRALICDPELLSLIPPSEALARRTGEMPYRFTVEIAEVGAQGRVILALSPDGTIVTMDGSAPARARVQTLVG